VLITSFRTTDLVEVETATVRALARVREVSEGGRLHIAFEMGEYFPWVDTDIQIRHFGNDPTNSCTARVLHAGSTTALLQLVDFSERQAAPPVVQSAAETSVPQEEMRAPYETLPFQEGERHR
jgi:hypothetical protein